MYLIYGIHIDSVGSGGGRVPQTHDLNLDVSLIDKGKGDLNQTKLVFKLNNETQIENLTHK